MESRRGVILELEYGEEKIEMERLKDVHPLSIKVLFLQFGKIVILVELNELINI